MAATLRSRLPEDVVVIGAGVSGLALARELQAHGRSPIVLERSRGVGGRCATRRIDGQPVDHGIACIHGRSRRFLAELDRVSDIALVPQWPSLTVGDGTPCRPEAFETRDRRVAFGAGVNRFAKHLAAGLNIRTEAEVTTLRLLDPGSTARSAWELTMATGDIVRCEHVALTMPAPAVAALLRQMAPPPQAIAGVLPLIDLVRTLPCLTVIARYPDGTASPSWQASFPRTSPVLQTIFHDSSKRECGSRLTLVIQARAAFSRAHLKEPVESWTRAMIESAAALHGDWIAAPDLVQSHSWSRARVNAGSELTRPLTVTLGDGALLGIAGDGFHAAGGIEGAYLSGIALAERFIAHR